MGSKIPGYDQSHILKRVLLIPPLTSRHSGMENFGIPALGPHRIAAYLRQFGHDVQIYDCNLSPRPFEETYLKKSFDVIGISILADTLIASLKFIRRLRGFWPQAKIIAGGIEASLNYQTVLDNAPVDAVCLGEGEEVMLQVCDGRINFHAIPGLVIKNKAIPINSDTLSGYWRAYDFSKVPYRQYWNFNRKLHGAESGETAPLVRLVTSSHCNRKCTFCSVRLWHEQACARNVPVAYLSPTQIEALLARITEQLPETKRIYFVEDDLIVTKKRIYDLMPVLRKFDFEYLIQTSTWMLTEEIVKKLASCGVIHITCGVENASSYVRDSLNKHQDDAKIEDIIRWCRQYHIRCYYLIILFPARTRMQDLQTNYETLSRWISEGVTISIEPCEMLYRGSLDYDSGYDFEYRVHNLDGHSLREPTIILPEDPEVRQIMLQFRERWPEYMKRQAQKERQRHFYKGTTGRWMVSLVGELLGKKT